MFHKARVYVFLLPIITNNSYDKCFSLKSRQDGWKKEADERRAALPDPELPEGHRLMPSHERRETLEKLKLSKQALNESFLLHFAT